MIKKYTNGYEAWYINQHPHGNTFRSPGYSPCAYDNETIVLLNESWCVVMYIKNTDELATIENQMKLKTLE